VKDLNNDPEYAKRWPSVWYGPDGQSAEFNSPLEVPEGWHDHPSKVGDKNAKSDIPFYEEAVAASESELTGGDEDEDEDHDPNEQEKLERGDGTYVSDETQDTLSSDPVLLPPIDEMDKDVIIARLKGIGPLDGQWQPNWSKQRLYDLLLQSVQGAHD